MMRRVLGLSALALAFSAPLSAQVWNYPALQTSRVSEREYNFILADGDGSGTALVLQWREGLGNPRLQFTLDAGFADPDAPGFDTRLMIGGGLAYQATTATADMPFDIVIAGGVGATFGDPFTTIRIPIGASIGHRFPLEGKYAITPFVHPRLNWTRTSFTGLPSDSDTGMDVDIGANFELSEQMAIRLAAALGDSDAIGVSFAWTPRGLRK